MKNQPKKQTSTQTSKPISEKTEPPTYHNDNKDEYGWDDEIVEDFSVNICSSKINRETTDGTL